MISDILLLQLLGKHRLQDLEGIYLRALTLHIFLECKQLLLTLDRLLNQPNHVLRTS